jgi:hypothetical protein
LTLRDWSGYGNHGTLTNMDPATAWMASRFGWGLKHTETDHTLITAMADPGDWTVVAVADSNPDLTGTRRFTFLGKATGEVSNSLLQIRSNGTVIVGFDDGSSHTWTVGDDLISGSRVWAVTKKGTAYNLYIDGVWQSPEKVSAQTFDWANINKIGVSNFFAPDWITINGLYFYNRALTSSEIGIYVADPSAIPRLRSQVYPAAAAPAVGNPWYYYQQQVAGAV